MKKLLLVIILGVIICSCTTTKYVEIPVDNIKTEYRDRFTVDTIMKCDSIITKEKGDTIYLEKYKYIYKVKERKDTVCITDTITVVQKVEVTKEINKLHNWQVILMILGGVAIALGGYKLIKLIKK